MLRSKFGSTMAAAGALALAVGGVVGFATPAVAVEIPVSSEAELVAAIDASNASPEADTIDIAAGTITLTDGLPTIIGDVTIRGAGSESTIITGAGAWRTFSAYSPSGVLNVEIDGLTVSESATMGIEAYATDLTLADVVVTASGFSGLTQVGGNLAVTDSSFTGGALGDGATIMSPYGATITITDSEFNGNTETGLRLGSSVLDGGGGQTIMLTDVVANDNGATGVMVGFDAPGVNNQVTLERVSADSNGFTTSNPADSFGITTSTMTGSTVSVIDSAATNNDLGGLRISGQQSTLNVATSTFSGNGNTDEGFGSGIQVINVFESDITVEASTVSGNHGYSAAGVLAALDNGATMTIVNSTISGNTADDAAGLMGLGEDGNTASLALVNTTVTGNSAGAGGVGGVTLSDIHTTVTDSLLAGNEGGDLDTGIDPSTSSVTVDHSLVQVPGTGIEAIVAAGVGNLVGVDPLLGPLADNGGQTLTHLQGEGSPVVDAGNPAVTGVPDTDQRGAGFNRIVRIIDMGAVEVQAPTPPTPPAPPTPVTPAGPELAATGPADLMPLMGVGVLMLLVGAAATYGRRLRTVTVASRSE